MPRRKPPPRRRGRVLGVPQQPKEEGGATPLVLRLPWPPKELSPNARVHWAQKFRVTADYRAAAWLAVREATGPFPHERGPLADTVTAKVVFVVPDKKRRDLDNALASMKAAWDGLVDAGLLVDDDSEHLKLAAPEMRVQRGEKYAEITLR